MKRPLLARRRSVPADMSDTPRSSSSSVRRGGRGASALPPLRTPSFHHCARLLRDLALLLAYPLWSRLGATAKPQPLPDKNLSVVEFAEAQLPSQRGKNPEQAPPRRAGHHHAMSVAAKEDGIVERARGLE